MKSLKSKKGFTLIELVVVIAILGILAGIAIPRFMDATATARGAKIIADLRTIDSAIMIYNAKTGKLPTAMADLLSDADAAGSTQAKFKLLASEPKPASGSAIFPCKPTTKVEVSTATYNLSKAKDRAVIGTVTADQLAEGGTFASATL